MKKILVFTLSLMLILSSVSFAAVSSSGSRSSSRPSTSSSMPSVGNSTRQAAPSPSSPGTNYKPSAPSNSYSDKAPSSQVKPGAQANTQQSSGGFWRNAGLFGGGMLLGSLLSHAFGFNPMSGMASMFGILFNVLILAAVIMGIRYLWNKFRSSDRRNM